MIVPGVATGAGHYQAQIEAIKAMSSLIEVDEETFLTLLRSRPNPTIVAGQTGALWFKKTVYLTSYDGFIFLWKAEQPRDFGEEAPGAFFVEAKTLTLPTL